MIDIVTPRGGKTHVRYAVKVRETAERLRKDK